MTFVGHFFTHGALVKRCVPDMEDQVEPLPYFVGLILLETEIDSGRVFGVELNFRLGHAVVFHQLLSCVIVHELNIC
jgi:hypothetical protein